MISSNQTKHQKVDRNKNEC